MTAYRANRLDEQGRVCGVMVGVAESSDDAVAQAGALEGPFGIELWLRDQCVAKVAGDAPGASAEPSRAPPRFASPMHCPRPAAARSCAACCAKS